MADTADDGGAAAAPDHLSAADAPPTSTPRWPGWPGDSVFRLIVPLLAVGGIIGRKGELVKRMCEETRSRIRVLDGSPATTDRIVLISAKEEPDAAVSPAMEGVMRVFKKVSGVPEGDGEAVAMRCSIRLLVPGAQAIYLIGKQGSVIKSIQERSGASVRVLPENEVPFYAAAEERIVDIQGEYAKVLKAIEAVTGLLRKFLVDHSVLPLFEKSYNAAAAPERSADLWSDKALERTSTGISSDYPLSMKRESLYFDREHQLESQIAHSRLSIHGPDPTLPGPRTSSGLGRAIVTQVTQTMQIPLSYAEDIIGVAGANIAFIRGSSGALLTVQESVGMSDEITVEIKGTSTQVQIAQQLIQDCIAVHKEPSTGGYGMLDGGSVGSYGSRDAVYRSSFSTMPPHSQDDYRPPLGGYGRYRFQ